jgi:hypothetical protein
VKAGCLETVETRNVDWAQELRVESEVKLQALPCLVGVQSDDDLIRISSDRETGRRRLQAQLIGPQPRGRRGQQCQARDQP